MRKVSMRRRRSTQSEVAHRRLAARRHNGETAACREPGKDRVASSDATRRGCLRDLGHREALPNESGTPAEAEAGHNEFR